MYYLSKCCCNIFPGKKHNSNKVHNSEVEKSIEPSKVTQKTLIRTITYAQLNFACEKIVVNVYEYFAEQERIKLLRTLNSKQRYDLNKSRSQYFRADSMPVDSINNIIIRSGLDNNSLQHMADNLEKIGQYCNAITFPHIEIDLESDTELRCKMIELLLGLLSDLSINRNMRVAELIEYLDSEITPLQTNYPEHKEILLMLIRDSIPEDEYSILMNSTRPYLAT